MKNLQKTDYYLMLSGFLFGSIFTFLDNETILLSIGAGIFWMFLFYYLRRLYLRIKKNSKPGKKSNKLISLSFEKKVFWSGFLLGFIAPLTDLENPTLSLFDFPLSGAFIGFLFWITYKIIKFISNKISKLKNK